MIVITIGRKPLIGSMSSNVLNWGVGGLNIDASRVKHMNQMDINESVNKNRHKDFNSNNGIRVPTKGIYGGDFRSPENYEVKKEGRHPPNVILASSIDPSLFPCSASTAVYMAPDKGGTGNCYMVPHKVGSVRGHSDIFSSNKRFFKQDKKEDVLFVRLSEKEMKDKEVLIAIGLDFKT